MTSLETCTVLIFAAGFIMTCVGPIIDSTTPTILGILLAVLSFIPAAFETHSATPVEATTPVELLEVEHQRVLDSIELEYTIELKKLELELEQLK